MAVVASLVYVGLQVRQSNTLARVDTEMRNSSNAADFTALVVADPSLADLWQRGLRGREPLDEREQNRFNLLLGSLFYRLEGVFFQYRRGLLTAAAWRAWEELILATQRSPAGRFWWGEVRFPFSRDFREHVDALLAATAKEATFRLVEEE